MMGKRHTPQPPISSCIRLGRPKHPRLDDPYWVGEHRRDGARFGSREQVLRARGAALGMSGLHVFFNHVVAGA